MPTPEELEKLRAKVTDAKSAQEGMDSPKALEFLEKQLEILQEIADKDSERLQHLVDIADAEKKVQEALAERLRLEQELESAMAAGDAAAQAAAQTALDTNAVEERKTKKKLRDINKMHKEMLGLLKKLNVERTGAVITTNELDKAIKRQKDTLESAESGANAFLSVFKGSRGVIGSLIEDAGRLQGGMLNASAGWRKFGKTAGPVGKFVAGNLESMTGKLGTMSKGMGMLLTAMIAVIAKVGKMALEIDNLSKGFAKSTGFGDKFQGTIKEVGSEAMLSGVGFQEAADALGSLSGNFSAFNPNAKSTNKYLAKTVGLLGQIGVSGDSAAQAMDIMNRAMGLSAQVAADMTAQLAMLGKEIGITAQKMVSEFAAANKRLAMYGKDNIKVFKELMGIVKATGLEMGVITKVAEQFDTFESAAESAAKLNAHLGTNIDMIGTMNMESAEKVLLIRNEVRARVGNMDSLNKFEKRMVAQAMGLSNVEEAQRLLNMSMAEYNSVTSGMQEQADVQQELADAAAEVIPVMQRLGLIFLKFLTFLQPVFDLFFNIFDLIERIYDGFVDLSGGAANATSIMKGVGYVLSAVVIGLAAFAAGLPVATAAVVAFVTLGLSELWSWLMRSGSPKLWQMPGVLADSFERFANAVTNAKESVSGFVKKGLKSIFSMFHKAGSPMLYLLPSVMAEGFIAISDAITNTVNALSNMISLMIEFAGIDFDGFIAVRQEGGATSLVMGSEGIISAMSEGRLTVDVNMPEIKLPPIEVSIIFNGTVFENIIDAKINDRLGA